MKDDGVMALPGIDDAILGNYTKKKKKHRNQIDSADFVFPLMGLSFFMCQFLRLNNGNVVLYLTQDGMCSKTKYDRPRAWPGEGCINGRWQQPQQEWQ